MGDIASPPARLNPLEIYRAISPDSADCTGGKWGKGGVDTWGACECMETTCDSAWRYIEQICTRV